MTIAIMTEAEVLARLEELGRPNTMKTGRVSLPNHLEPNPLTPDVAKENRAELWWIRVDTDCWRVA